MRKQTAVWTTRDGRKVRLCDMADSHLLNTIKYLKKRTEARLAAEIALGYRVLCGLQGEMAQLCVEQDLDRLESEDPESFLLEHFPLYEKLLLEAERRKLPIGKTTD